MSSICRLQPGCEIEPGDMTQVIPYSASTQLLEKEFFDLPPIVTTNATLKCYNSGWYIKNLKFWNGSVWVQKHIKIYNGISWINLI